MIAHSGYIDDKNFDAFAFLIEDGVLQWFNPDACEDCSHCPLRHCDCWYDGTCDGCEVWSEYISEISGIEWK